MSFPSPSAWGALHFARRHWRLVLATVGVALVAAAALAILTRLGQPGVLADFPSWLPRGDATDRFAPIATSRAATIADQQTLLRATAVVLAILSGLALAGLGVIRAGRQGHDTAIHRAVGASRRVLRTAAGLEAACVVVLVTIAAAALATFGWSWAERTWPGSPGSAPLAASALALLPIGAAIVATLWSGRVGSARRIHAPSGPPLELHVAGLLLGVGAAAVAAALLLAPNVVRRPVTTLQLMHLRADRSPPATIAALLSDLAPGLALASAGTELGLGAVEQATTDCGECRIGSLPARFLTPRVVTFAASPDTFGAIGARLLAGRLLTPEDAQASEPVVVVNRALAANGFEAAGAVGRRLLLDAEGSRWYRVVGVVDTPTPTGFGAAQLPAEQAWFALPQRPAAFMTVMGRPGVTLPADALVVGAGAEVLERTSLAALARVEASRLRWLHTLLLLAGATALGVAALTAGLLVAGWLAAVRPEVGVRRSVGATRARIVRELGAHLARMAAIATLGAVVAGSGFRAKLAEIAGPQLAWSPAQLLVVLAAMWCVAVALAALPATALLRWSPSRLLSAES